MKIKIPEEIIKEFIGTNLEPIEGNLNPIQSTFTTVNQPTPDDEENVPPTTDKFIQHARTPWWWTRMNGGYGYASVGIASESQNNTIKEIQVKEDVITGKPTNNGEIIRDKNIPSLDDLERVYDQPLMKKQVFEFTKMLQSMGSNIGEADEADVLAIILNYVLTNVNTASLSDDYKKKIKNGIK